MQLIILLSIFAVTQALLPTARFAVRHHARLMDSVDIERETADDSGDDVVAVDSPKTGEGLFNMNRRVRLGRSRDQDGKSNIWSIEPKMEVEEEGESSGKSNLLIGAAVVATALACLPLFSLFSTLFPDPADF